MSGYSHVIGFDDAPFARQHRGNVLVVGAVYSDTQLQGVLSAPVRRDGVNATRVLAELVGKSRFASHTQLIMLQGIAFAGFNVVDLPELHHRLQIPCLVVARRAPDFGAIRRALLGHVPGGRRKWRLIERAGPMEATADLYVQRAGLTLPAATRVLRRLALNGLMPEPLRVAHLIAGGLVSGHSRGRA